MTSPTPHHNLISTFPAILGFPMILKRGLSPKMASMVDSFKTGEVPKPTDLTRKIEVIGAGLGRTGTMSFSAALEKLLNGPVYHSGNMLISDEEYIAAPPLRALSKLRYLP
jgi:hypothetical protein